MRVKSLTLRDFRNFTVLQAGLSPGINIIYGDNGQGKTNFLEAIYFCATGRSQRTSSERELIRFGQREARLRMETAGAYAERSVDAYISQDKRRGFKGINVDHIPVKQLSELIGLLPVVAFAPDDLRLIKAGPAERRAFMDRELCQIHPVYYHALRQYHHALKQRNHLLKTLQKDRSLTGTVFIWDEQLAAHGCKIMSYRAAFIRRAGELARETHGELTGGAEELTMVYKPHITDPAEYPDKLAKGLTRALALGATGSGPHRDDLQFLINGSDARVYGSQGQQRTAALSAKLAEIGVIREDMSAEPVLLLDDVLSELDGRRQAFLLSRIGPLQTVMACTGAEGILRDGGPGAKVMRMTGGVLE